MGKFEIPVHFFYKDNFLLNVIKKNNKHTEFTKKDLKGEALKNFKNHTYGLIFKRKVMFRNVIILTRNRHYVKSGF